MTSEYSMARARVARRRILVEQMRVRGWSWSSGGAACGLGLGIVCPIMGSILTAIAWFTGPHWHGSFIQRYGAVLLFLTIPLLIFGAHCLDVMDQQADRVRKSRYRRI